MLTATKVIAWARKRRDELAHAALTTPPANMEELMRAVGEYKSLADLEDMVREKGQFEDDEP